MFREGSGEDSPESRENSLAQLIAETQKSVEETHQFLALLRERNSGTMDDVARVRRRIAAWRRTLERVTRSQR